jgi:hypothetical protein
VKEITHSSEKHLNLCSLHCWDDYMMEGEVSGRCSMHGETRSAYNVLVGKPERNRPPGTSLHKWEDNRLDCRQISCKGVEWMQLTWDRV